MTLKIVTINIMTFSIMIPNTQSGKTNYSGRFSTVGLFTKLDCFAVKGNN
jgi:hypothetical protein